MRFQSVKSFRSRSRLLLVGLSYLLTGLLGLEFYPTSGFATLIWPPSAISIVATVVWGPGVWPAIYVAALMTNLIASAPLPVAGVIAAGNTLEALVAFLLLRRFGFDRRLGEVRSALALILAGALGSGVSATVGVSSLRRGGIVLVNEFADTWFVWWFGDMGSIIVLAPLLFLAGGWRAVIREWNPAEFGLLSALSAMLLLFLFGDVIVPPGIPYPTMFLLFPFIIWAALRFGTLGSALTIGIVASVAILATVSGHGPYAGLEPRRGILILQLFMTVGAMTGLIVAADSDQRHRAEASLRARSTDLEQTKAWLQTALEAGNIAVWEWNLKTGEVLRTDGQDRLFGNRQPLSTWDYDKFMSVVHPDDRPRIAELAKEIRFAKTPVVTGEFRSIWPDLSIHWYFLRGRIYLDEAHRPDRASGVFVDISRERDLELELGEVLLSREEISHDLKNPLQAILMNTEVLRRSSARSLGEEFVQMRLHGIAQSANRMRSLIEAILDVTRIRGGHLVLDKKPHDLRAIVDEVVVVHLPLAESRDVRLNVACDTGRRLVVCDRGRISQVLSNLVANAIQHSPRGETVRIKAQEEGDQIRVAVSNVGPVIPPEHIRYVFERYWRGRGSPGEGTGLGLFISRGIVEAHGRRIEVTSEPRTGTTFRFTLQAAQPDATAGRAA
jgi:signal transduction histidine kinase/integral membrane sensor domain MASE1